LVGEIARGGMGAILRVWDEDLGRHLAMKVILGQPELGGGGDRKRTSLEHRTLGQFLEEAQITGQLDHPGIVPVHELGLDAGGRVFFTMRLVKGRELREILELVEEGDEGWSRTRALGVLLKVCEAMAFAHSRGVIHRDLKPANIMVGRFGEVYVMDWGLGRVLGREDSHDLRLAGEPASASVVCTFKEGETPDEPLLTLDHHVVGTPSYMSPEQARGAVDEMGTQTDVYSVGAILYQLLTGRLPYVPGGSTPKAHMVWKWVLEGPPRPVTDIRRDVPAELVAICEKAMAREVADRYPDMEAMSEDLRAFLENRVVRAHRTGALPELRKWMARNPVVAAAVSAALVVTVVAGVLVASSESRRARVVQARYDEELAGRLLREAEASWPVHPDSVPEMRRWIEEAEALLAATEEARGSTTPRPGGADPAADEIPFELKHKTTFLEGYLGYVEEYTEALARPDLDPREKARFAHNLEVLRLEIPLLEEQIAAWHAEREQPASAFLASLRSLGTELADVRELLRLGEGLADASLVEPADDWEACIASVADEAECPLYEGMTLRPVLGLVPLRRDPESGLWEFWHVLSGERPAFEPGGPYAIRHDTGLVMVLVPGSLSYLLGAQSTDPTGPNYDPNAPTHEGPPRDVPLAPYLLSKYEMTQGQWLRLTGEMPSEQPAGYEYAGYWRISRTHPVEHVSALDAERFLPRWALELPTEAQWERAARAGGSDAFVTGPRFANVEGFANVADLALVDYGFDRSRVSDWTDGYVFHSPVDAFRPNPFGLFGMVGNVSEWARDQRCGGLSDEDVAEVRPSTGELVPPYGNTRSVRGGSYKSDRQHARVAERTGYIPDTRTDVVGLRPGIDLH
jgi:formylglycine-generating enzyme required for sulfatase activity